MSSAPSSLRSSPVLPEDFAERARLSPRAADSGYFEMGWAKMPVYDPKKDKGLFFDESRHPNHMVVSYFHIPKSSILEFHTAAKAAKLVLAEFGISKRVDLLIRIPFDRTDLIKPELMERVFKLVQQVMTSYFSKVREVLENSDLILKITATSNPQIFSKTDAHLKKTSIFYVAREAVPAEIRTATHLSDEVEKLTLEEEVLKLEEERPHIIALEKLRSVANRLFGVSWIITISQLTSPIQSGKSSPARSLSPTKRSPSPLGRFYAGLSSCGQLPSIAEDFAGEATDSDS